MYHSTVPSKRNDNKDNPNYQSLLDKQDAPELKNKPQTSIFGFSVKKQSSNQRLLADKKVNQSHSFSQQRARAKMLLISYIKHTLKVNSFSQEIVAGIQSIDYAGNFDELVEKMLLLVTSLFSEEKQKIIHKYIQEQRIKGIDKEVSLKVRSKETKLLRLIKEDTSTDNLQKGKSLNKMQQLQKINENLKKQIFELKEDKKFLEHKILSIIEQYKNRKSFYLAEIKKLTDIINMTSFDVRNLVLQKTKEAKLLNHQLQEPAETIHNTNSPQIPKKQRREEEDNYTVNPQARYKQKTLEDSRGLFNGYNTEIKILKGVSSIQNIDEEKIDSRLLF